MNNRELCDLHFMISCFSIFFHIHTKYGIHSVNLRIQSKYDKIRTRTNSVHGHFSRNQVS